MKASESVTWSGLIGLGWERVRGQVARMTNRDDAEDLMHDAWLGLAERQIAARNPTALLVRAAANRGVDAFRREQRTGSAISADQAAESIADLTPLQDEVLIARHRLERLRHGVNQLKPRTRQILLMHRLEGLKYREIAEALAISQSAVEKHIASAMESLTDWMEDW
ncbi:RNA polymerase sigma factor [Blastomonas aquatica]|uniref:RNA polymerase subunit sigma-24 n=1 Tax=Blastomonas aquatica TaxID=1510276 RepID=A0ABQ1J317_9SPHN|nr:sigma-70 family RNA polymerase sigma factor [Blastomonas aquatica]GGB56766.1 hypothetical protein GCM10010833_09360 [Blastomonas aquatica]